MTTWAACAVTGHRDLSNAQLGWLRSELDRVNLRLVAEFGTLDAATGMARGADLDFGWSALFAGMRIHAHIPYPQQPDGRDWTDGDRDSYTRLLARCTSKVEYGRAPNVGLLFARNEGLLNFVEDRAGVLVAVWDPDVCSGGTFYTVRKAAERGLPVIHLDPAASVTHGPGCSCVMGPGRTRPSAP